MKKFVIKVTFSDGDYLYTAINGESEDDVREYYIGKPFAYGFDDGNGWREYTRTATAVEFL